LVTGTGQRKSFDDEGEVPNGHDDSEQNGGDNHLAFSSTSPDGNEDTSFQKRNEPFRRVTEESVDQKLVTKMSDHLATAQDSYGERAKRDLGHLHGKDFRHEKTKKKRGSYRGGPIDTSKRSINFTDSDFEGDGEAAAAGGGDE